MKCWGDVSLSKRGRRVKRWVFFLSQSSQSSRSIFTHISSPQMAFDRQRTQSVTAIVDNCLNENGTKRYAFVISKVSPIKWLIIEERTRNGQTKNVEIFR